MDTFKTMKIIRLTESQLKNIIRESVCHILTEKSAKEYKGSRKDSDERLMAKHSHIYENTLQDHIEIEESTGEYGDINITAYVNGQLAGYMILVIHKDLDDLDSEISDTDSPETAMMVTRKLDYNKPTVELADVDIKKEFRSQGLSKILLEYTLNKFQGYQFYLRVYPTDGVDEQTLANSLVRYGFVVVDSTENGTFLVKR